MHLAERFKSPPEMYPFFDFFAQIVDSPGHFKKLLQSYAQQEGYSLDYHHSAFPRDIDPAEEASFEDSIRFLVEYGIGNDQEVIVSYQKVYYYLYKFRVLYLMEHPDDKQEINYLLGEVKKALIPVPASNQLSSRWMEKVFAIMLIVLGVWWFIKGLIFLSDFL